MGPSRTQGTRTPTRETARTHGNLRPALTGPGIPPCKSALRPPRPASGVAAPGPRDCESPPRPPPRTCAAPAPTPPPVRAVSFLASWVPPLRPLRPAQRGSLGCGRRVAPPSGPGARPGRPPQRRRLLPLRARGGRRRGLGSGRTEAGVRTWVYPSRPHAAGRARARVSPVQPQPLGQCPGPCEPAASLGGDPRTRGWSLSRASSHSDARWRSPAASHRGFVWIK